MSAKLGSPSSSGTPVLSNIEPALPYSLWASGSSGKWQLVRAGPYPPTFPSICSHILWVLCEIIPFVIAVKKVTVNNSSEEVNEE